MLRQRGKTLEGIAYLLDLWREYPDTASIESDFFGLSQVLARHAGQAITDPALRSELADGRRDPVGAAPAGDPADPGRSSPSRPRTRWPTRRAWRSWATSSSSRITRPSSSSRPGSPSSIPRARSSTASSTARRSASSTSASTTAPSRWPRRSPRRRIKDADGVEQPSPNKWQAIYILGQIYDARRQPAKALEVLRQVAERFTDAAGAIKSFTRKDLKLPEVTVVRPRGRPKVAAAEPAPRRSARRGQPGDEPDREVRDKPEVKLDYRNIAEADVKVYPVDLMRLYLTRRNLDQIAGIDLAGITPAVRDDDQARRRRGLRRQGPGDRPAARRRKGPTS